MVAQNSGAVVTFEGRIRSINEAQSVLKLHYEAYEVLAIKEGERIIEEAYQLFRVKSASCIHRLGELKLGDLAVFIIVYSEHRREAFRATEYIIDQIKVRVPIWKKEFYQRGDPLIQEEKNQWVLCSH